MSMLSQGGPTRKPDRRGPPRAANDLRWCGSWPFHGQLPHQPRQPHRSPALVSQ